MNILVIAAHPDDEILGCGGTISRLSEEGHDVTIAILGEGLTSRCNDDSETPKYSIEDLRNCSKLVSLLINAKNIIHYDLPDNRFDSMDFLDIVKIIESLILRVNPDWIFTHHPGDLNIDHRIVFQSTLTAARPMNGTFLRAIYAFEIPSSTEWSFQKFQPVFSPNVFFDISSSIKKKVEALQIYISEIRDYPHPRSSEGIKILAQTRGIQVGLQYAEAFETIYEIR